MFIVHCTLWYTYVMYLWYLFYILYIIYIIFKNVFTCLHNIPRHNVYIAVNNSTATITSPAACRNTFKFNWSTSNPIPRN